MVCVEGRDEVTVLVVVDWTLVLVLVLTPLPVPKDTGTVGGVGSGKVVVVAEPNTSPDMPVLARKFKNAEPPEVAPKG